MTTKRQGLFGSRILGKERALSEREEVLSKRAKFGPRVLGYGGAKPGTNTPRTPVVKLDIAALSVAEMKTILAENPGYFPPFYNREWDRAEAGGVRREAIEMFLLEAPRCMTNKVELARVVTRMTVFLETGKDEVGDKVRAKIAKDLARMRKLQEVVGTPAPAPVPDSDTDDLD